MLARVHIQLPYAFIVPKDEKYNVYEYEKDDYTVKVYMLERSERADSYNETDSVTIDEQEAFNADVLRIDYQKDDFERKKANSEKYELVCDPPIDFIKDTANEFLARLRYVTGGSKIKLLQFPSINWNLRYLNDDGSELPKEEGYRRGLGGRKFEFSYIAINKEVWDNVHSIDPFQPLPIWKTLLLDAESMLPEIGPAIILTFTALDVFISIILDEIVKTGKIDTPLWDWINDRGFHLKNPSVDDKFSFLSDYLIGKSIKDDSDLWSSFKDLQKARNSFAHNGVAIVNNTEVTLEKARKFIIKTNEIINFIKEDLPKEQHWPEFEHNIKVGLTHTLIEKAADDK